jgi:hypothetical protein
MKLLSARVLVPVAVVVIAWGGAHLLTAHNLAVTPATWPSSATAPSPTTAGTRALPPGLSTPASPSLSSGASAVPILPGALQQLNGDTRDTAIGLYALIQQLENALRSDLQQLVQRLEPGR